MLGAQKRRLLMWGCDAGHAARPLIFKKVPPYRKQTSYLQEDASVEEALELDMPRNCSMLTTNGPSMAVLLQRGGFPKLPGASSTRAVG